MRMFLSALVLVIIQRTIMLMSAVHISIRQNFPLSPLLLWSYGYKHFDGGWYIEIAQNGYTNLKQTAFWPLYPWIMRIVHSITGLSYPTSGVIISTVCFVIALFFLGLLAERNFGFTTAIITMTLFTFFPTSYYFDSVYTEALFALLTISSVYAANTNRFMLAAILAALATLTRNTGVLLCLVMFFEYARSRCLSWRFWQLAWWRKLDWSILWLLLPPLALVGYGLWLRQQFGNFLAFMEAEKYWHRAYMQPWDVIANTIYLYQHPHATIMQHQYILFEILSFAFAVLVLIMGLFYARKSVTHFSLWLFTLAVAWITSTEPSMNIPDYLVSFPRYVLMLFPGFMCLAHAIRRPKWLVVPIAFVFAVFLYRESGLFYIGQWVA